MFNKDINKENDKRFKNIRGSRDKEHKEIDKLAKNKIDDKTILDTITVQDNLEMTDA